MGIDKNRFKSEIQDGFVCPLCQEVFEDPVQVIKCQDSFCKKCLEEKLKEQSICPNEGCGEAIGDGDWTNNKTLEKMMSGLLLTCPFVSLGCDQVVALSTLPFHTGECLYNPYLTQACVGGCGMQLTKQQVNSHRCVEALKEEMVQMNGKMIQVIETLKEENLQLKEELKKCQTRVEDFETDWKWEGVKKEHKEWLLQFPENANEKHHEYIERLKRNNLVKDRTMEMVLKRFNPENLVLDESQFSLDSRDRYFDYFVSLPTVLSTVRDNLSMGNTCWIIGYDDENYLSTCCALMVGPTGKIFVDDYYGGVKGIENNLGSQYQHLFSSYNRIEIFATAKFDRDNFDLQLDSISRNIDPILSRSFASALTTLDCIIVVGNYSNVEGFNALAKDRLKIGGRLIVLDPNCANKCHTFHLFEKINCFSTIRRKWMENFMYSDD